MPILTRAKIFDPSKPNESHYVQFNPNSLDYSAYTNKKAYKNVRDSTSVDAKKMQSSPTEYGTMANLSVRLFFHTYESETSYDDVRGEVNRIRAFLRKPTSSEQNGSKPADASTPKVEAPQIGFAWGTIVFVGSLEGFQVSYQMFAADGTPVQAEVSITVCGEDQDVVASSNEREGTMEYDSDNTAELPLDLEWLFE